MRMRVGMHLGPFYASTSLGGPHRPGRRRASSGGMLGLCLQLLIWTLQLSLWMLYVSLVVCWWMLKLTWVGGVWLAGAVSSAVRSRQAEQARQRGEAQAAAERAQA